MGIEFCHMLFFASVEMIIWIFFVWSVVMVHYFFNVKQSYIPVITALGYVIFLGFLPLHSRVICHFPLCPIFLTFQCHRMSQGALLLGLLSL